MVPWGLPSQQGCFCLSSSCGGLKGPEIVWVCLWVCCIVAQANIDKIVNAVKFQDDFVSGEEQLRAFQLVDDNTSRKLSVWCLWCSRWHKDLSAVSCCFIVAYLKMQHSCCATFAVSPTIREDKDPFMDWEEASQDKMSEWDSLDSLLCLENCDRTVDPTGIQRVCFSFAKAHICNWQRYGLCCYDLLCIAGLRALRIFVDVHEGRYLPFLWNHQCQWLCSNGYRSSHMQWEVETDGISCCPCNFTCIWHPLL